MGFNDSSAETPLLGSIRIRASTWFNPNHAFSQPCPKRPQICHSLVEIDPESPAEAFVAISIFGFVFFGISVTMKYSPSTCGSLATDFGTSPLLSQSQKKNI